MANVATLEAGLKWNLLAPISPGGGLRAAARSWYVYLSQKAFSFFACFSLSVIPSMAYSADLSGRFESHRLVPDFDYCFTLNKL